MSIGAVGQWLGRWRVCVSACAVVATSVLALAAPAPVAPTGQASRVPVAFSVVEASIAEMQRALDERRVTSRELVQQSLTRIALYEDQLNGIITVNGHALDEADARDRERAAGRVRGPLHGIPIALKDNIQTTNMPTTGGALAFAGLRPPSEATVARNLRKAGAIVLAKTQLTELANWVGSDMPANFNGLNGFGFNPYDPRRDPREGMADGRPALSTGGSSSGTGTAASFWAASVGTETSGSILSPANNNMLAAIKPTVGRVSRRGIIPITADQDTAGPMARWVADAAIMLGAMENARPDRRDFATRACTSPPGHDYTRFLDAGALRGARLGIPRAFFYDAVAVQGARVGGLNDDRRAAMDEAVAVMRQQGAVIVDPADLPSVVDADPAGNVLLWSACSGLGGGKANDAGCSVVLKYGMKRDFNAWLSRLGRKRPVKTLAQLRAWNSAHQDAGAIQYGQANLDISDEMNLDRDRSRYEADRKKDILLTATHGIDEVMKAARLDALIFPGGNGAAVAARPGYPTVIVPFAMVPNAPAPPFPAGFAARPAPFGISFTGMACSEPRLIALAYAFEQATKRRVGPPQFP